MTSRHPLAWYSRCAALIVFSVVLSTTSSAQRPKDVEVYQWNGTGFSLVHGAAGVRIAVGPNGAPWIVRSNGQIYRKVRDGYRRLPGSAVDIGIGGDGSAWIISSEDNGVYRWTGRAWEPYLATGVAISVDEDGDPWVVTTSGQIVRWDSDSERFINVPGTARDIGAESSIWTIGRDGNVRELQSNGRFSGVRGSGVRVSAGPNGQAWVVNEASEIYRWNGGQFERVAGAALDVASNARGDVFVIGVPVEEERRARQRRR
jgi:streptogramin lyase